jgi:RimJ/RimL family protein N-acetyltransferase
MVDIMDLALKTEHLTIRKLNEKDWPLFSHLYTDSQVMKHIGEPQEEITVKQIFDQRLLPWEKTDNNGLSLVIENNISALPIGLIGLKSQNSETAIAELGIMLDLGHSGKGYGSEALKSVINYAFNQLDFHKLTATCSINNLASQKALEKNGFIKEGVLRHNSLIDDNYIDDCTYGLLMHEAL